ncbi:MAG: hypothetical protein ACAI38_19370 [Myxococcota bacterium]
MRITPFGRYGVILVALTLTLALGIGKGASGMLLVAGAIFVLAYENMRRPLVEQGLRRTPWFVPRLIMQSDTVTLDGIVAPRTVRFADILRARLVYQESFDALVGVDDTLCLETTGGVVQVARSSEGFEALMSRLREAGIGVLMVRARNTE